MERDPASVPTTDSFPPCSDPGLDPGSQFRGKRRLPFPTHHPSAPADLPGSWCYFLKELQAGCCPGRFIAIHVKVFLAGAVWLVELGAALSQAPALQTATTGARNQSKR